MKIALGSIVLAFFLGLSTSNRSGVEQPSLIGAPAGSFCALLVPHADETAAWYRDYLGFHITRSAEGPGGTSRTIMLEQHGVLLEVIEARDSFDLQSVSRKKVNLLRGIRKFGIVTDQETFDALHSSLERKKATFVGDVYTDDGLKMRSFIVQDDSGNLVQFFSPAKS
jgi:catechol 2,3-dioxygenase-like lactoylglutathione lyase family enzyme